MSTLTTAEAADRLKMTPRTVARMAHAGEIEASYVGRRWVIPATAIEAYLAEHSNRERRPARRRRRRAA